MTPGFDKVSLVELFDKVANLPDVMMLLDGWVGGGLDIAWWVKVAWCDDIAWCVVG